MPEYLFPEVDRVIYGKAPLVEVICQVRFPSDLRIDTTPPAEYQQRIRSWFPVLTEHSRSRVSGLPPELQKAFESGLFPAGGSTTWAFSTEDGVSTLELQKDKLTLVTRDYRRWEEFSALFRHAFLALRDLYDPPFLTRVGLRYRDAIHRSKLQLDNERWSTLLTPHVLAEIAEPWFEDRAEEASRNLLLRLPDQDARVRLQHGFAQPEGSSEQVYLIDCDFFVDRTEAAHAERALQYFNGNAARFFRWCITDRLHQAMEPRPVI